MRTYEDLLRENVELRRLVAEQERQLSGQQELIAQQERRLAEQQKRIDQLEKVIERLGRQGKRQAAPFSKGTPKAKPKRPGRKPGKGYGRQALRQQPERVDESITVGCPLYCVECEGRVRLEGKASQYQVDVPPMRPRVVEFIVHYGRCQRCGRRAQARHPRQVSDALGVGRVHFGPNVVALGAYLNKLGGLSWEKISGLFSQWMGLSVARSSLCRAAHRLSQKAKPTYDGLVASIRGSPVVSGDETGWRVAGLPAWLWTFTNARETAYVIERGRGYAEASLVLGEDYEGILVVDGWAPYRRFELATLQTCLAHLLRRCSQMLETASRGAVRFPRAVQEILQHSLALRERRQNGELGDHGLRVAVGLLKARLHRLLGGRFTNLANRRLARHLRRYENALFVFLEHDDVPATNWHAEHALRGAVVNRKTSGGNRSSLGAQTQAVLTSLLRSCHQQQLDPFALFTDLLRQPVPLPHPALVTTNIAAGR